VPEWQERLTRETHPTIRIEHELRYRLAAQLIGGSATWCDLGCGSGVASAAALGDARPERVVLVDLDADAVAEAAVELATNRAETLAIDLADDRAVTSLRDVLLRQGGGGAITCFEVVEHLRSFVPLLELLVELAGAHHYTVLLSVPNDAFGGIENPYHQTMWGEGAFEELRRMLPADHVVATQIPLAGSALVIVGADDTDPAYVGRPDPVPSHFLVAFGPRAAELTPMAAVEMTDLAGQRLWERQRETTLAFHEDELAELRDYAIEVRDYAHELERRLGERPPADDAA
jgi:SAM-dependent methyltransferase